MTTTRTSSTGTVTAGEGRSVERVVSIRRVAKVVAGGRRFTFTALVVVGDQNGQVGIGYEKGEEIPDAVRKATNVAKKHMITVPLNRRSIPHEIVAQFGASRVLLKPAAPGTGVIAGSSVRAVLEAAGIADILTKSYGSRNPINVVKAAFKALQMLRAPKAAVAERRKLAQQGTTEASSGPA